MEKQVAAPWVTGRVGPDWPSPLRGRRFAAWTRPSAVEPAVETEPPAMLRGAP